MVEMLGSWKRKNLFSRDGGTGFQSIQKCGVRCFQTLLDAPSSVSDDRATVSGDHHVCRVVTITETERQNLAAKNAGPATDQCWSSFGTAWWDARGDFIAAAGAGIFNAPRDWNRWGGRAAYGLAANGLAAIHGGTATAQQAEATRFCL